MIGQSFKCSRVDQITSVDTTAHLMTIRDLEEKLSNHHRRDRVPVWAESLIRRVEELENSAYKISSISQLPSVPSKCNPVLPSSTLPDDVATFNAKIDEMKSYLESQVSSSQHHQASRIEMVHSEIERLHSLMSIRPTTADFQLVVVSLNDVHRRMYDSLDDIAAGIG